MKIQTTTDYSKFKSIDGNRNKNLMHINRLKKSMQQNYLFTIIVVNERFEIIDGQHRFDVISELGLPLNYVVCQGYGLNEVHVLNQNSKTWTSLDYLEAYCNLGYKDYLLFRKFSKIHDINIQITMYLLSGQDSGNMIKIFNSGDFKIKNINKADDIMNKIEMVSHYYQNYKRRWFVYAMAKVLDNKKFNIHEFLTKLKMQPALLKDCVNVNQYVELIEQIYNYKRREKVNLRF